MSDDLVGMLKDASLEALSFEDHELWHEVAAEIARLAAEIVRLTAERDEWKTAFEAENLKASRSGIVEHGLSFRVDVLTAERDAERDARKRLGVALRELTEAADSVSWSANIGTMDEALDLARAALGGSDDR